MKKKNLNWMLAALAALALVFAAGCDTNGDGASGSGGYTSDYSGATYTYESTGGAIWEADATHDAAASTTAQYLLGTVSLAFASSGTGVTVTVDYASCTNGESNADSGVEWNEAGSYHTATSDVHYRYVDSNAEYLQTASGVVVTIPADEDNATGIVLTFTASNGILTLAGTNMGTASYTVKGTDVSNSENVDSTGRDLFGSSWVTDYGPLVASASGSTFNPPSNGD